MGIKVHEAIKVRISSTIRNQHLVKKEKWEGVGIKEGCRSPSISELGKGCLLWVKLTEREREKNGETREGSTSLQGAV